MACDQLQRQLDNHIKNKTKKFLNNMQPHQARHNKTMTKAEWLLLLPWALASRKPEFDEWRSQFQSQVRC